MVEAIIGNVNHLSKSESLHYSCKVPIWLCLKNVPEKEYSGTFKKSKLLPENQLQMENSK